MNRYKMKINIAWLKRKRAGLLKKLKDTGPFVDGSIAKVKRRCGNKNCKCYREGKKHESYYLMYKVAGITKAVYIPVDLEDEVKKWNEEYRRLKETVREISRTNKEIIRRYVSEKRLKKGRI
jgi:recombinational DNA repair protein (RecF pathway)